MTLNTQMPLNPIHVSLMHNGRVLIVSGSGNLPSDTTYLGAVWDPTTDTVTTQPVPFDMFCNGMVVLPDGRPFVISGTNNTIHFMVIRGLRLMIQLLGISCSCNQWRMAAGIPLRQHSATEA